LRRDAVSENDKIASFGIKANRIVGSLEKEWDSILERPRRQEDRWLSSN
jgi:hypothetical protein